MLRKEIDHQPFTGISAFAQGSLHNICSYVYGYTYKYTRLVIILVDEKRLLEQSLSIPIVLICTVE